jgi:RNA polymerase sigma-70 factor (ECF subfamily)
MTEKEQGDLVARAKVDPEAFGELYRQHVERIYSYHYRHTSNRADAEDLTSRTFYRALRSLQGYRETGAPFQAWLYRIAHNLLVNWYRDHGTHPTISLDVDEPTVAARIAPLQSAAMNPELWVATAESREALRRVIASLPEDRKTLIFLKFFEEMSNVEIAEVLGKTEGAIKALYHRTLIHLRRTMEASTLEDAGDAHWQGAMDVPETA